jgi:hypothetical protein
LKNRAAPLVIRRSLIRASLDAIAIFGLFTMVFGGLYAVPLAAHPMPIVTAGQTSPAGTGDSVAMIAAKSLSKDAPSALPANVRQWTLFGVFLSLIAALNLAMARHIRRTYLVPARKPSQLKISTKEL